MTKDQYLILEKFHNFLKENKLDIWADKQGKLSFGFQTDGEADILKTYMAACYWHDLDTFINSLKEEDFNEV